LLRFWQKVALSSWILARAQRVVNQFWSHLYLPRFPSRHRVFNVPFRISRRGRESLFGNWQSFRQTGRLRGTEPSPNEPEKTRKTGLTPRSPSPAIPDKVDLTQKDALVYLVDIYRGNGLAGVPRGAVKRLRLITYHFCYQGLGGQYDRVGLDEPWDVKQVLGTVPVESDGSAAFRVPANLPVAVQPLDGDGKALQLMRSWFVGMPGEVINCVGCHESQDTVLPTKPTRAARRTPSTIEPFYGPHRGFSFQREVQPVLDRFCVGCHDGRRRQDGQVIADLRDAPMVKTSVGASRFSPSYMALRRMSRTPTMEPDLH
jgi:hypothetical protein